MGVYTLDCGCVWASVDGRYWDIRPDCPKHAQYLSTERGGEGRVILHHPNCECSRCRPQETV